MLTPIKQEEKSSLNIVFQLYKEAINNNSVDEMNDINFIAVHNQRYPVVLEWSKWIIELINKWKNQLDSDGRKRCFQQYRYLLEKIEIYKKIMVKNVPEDLVLPLEKEFDFRKANWNKEQTIFTTNLKKWNDGKLNCVPHKTKKLGNVDCQDCIKNFDSIILSRLKEVKDQINFLQANQVNQFNKEGIINQLVNLYNSLIDMRLINRETIKKN